MCNNHKRLNCGLNTPSYFCIAKVLYPLYPSMSALGYGETTCPFIHSPEKEDEVMLRGGEASINFAHNSHLVAQLFWEVCNLLLENFYSILSLEASRWQGKNCDSQSVYHKMNEHRKFKNRKVLIRTWTGKSDR